jgi:hypothetical protein
LFKKLLDNVKADDKRANLRMRKKVSENMSNMVQAQNDSELFILRDFLVAFIKEASSVRAACRNVAKEYEEEISSLKAQLKGTQKPGISPSKTSREKSDKSDRGSTPTPSNKPTATKSTVTSSVVVAEERVIKAIPVNITIGNQPRTRTVTLLRSSGTVRKWGNFINVCDQVRHISNGPLA